MVLRQLLVAVCVVLFVADGRDRRLSRCRCRPREIQGDPLVFISS